jgi:ribonuclease P protein component
MATPTSSALQPRRSLPRLRKHADYQRIYKSSRKQFSASMTYFHAPRPSSETESPRVGLTAGRVLGNAVERNRIKRRMREAVRRHLHLLPLRTDVVLHPRRSVLEIDFAELSHEVERIFLKIAGSRP